MGRVSRRSPVGAVGAQHRAASPHVARGSDTEVRPAVRVGDRPGTVVRESPWASGFWSQCLQHALSLVVCGAAWKNHPLIIPFSHIPKPLPIRCRRCLVPRRGGEPSGGAGGRKAGRSHMVSGTPGGTLGAPAYLRTTLIPLLLNSPPDSAGPGLATPGSQGTWALCFPDSAGPAPTLHHGHPPPPKVSCKPLPPCSPPGPPCTVFLSAQPAPRGRPSCSAL